MRILMWFTLGFGVACAMGGYLWAGQLFLYPAIGAILAAVGLLFGGRQWRGCRAASIACFGLAVGLFWFWGFDKLYLAPVKSLDGQTAAVTAVASGYSRPTNYGTSVDAVVYCEGRPYEVRLYLNQEAVITPGDTIAGTFCLRLTTGGSQETTYHQSLGIFLLGYAAGEASVTDGAVPWWCYPAKLRAELQILLNEAFPEDTVGIARALLLGDTSGLDYETDTALKLSGIRHIVAVSGLHVSILFSAVYVFSGKRKWPTALISIPLLVLFAAVAGFTPSVTRACLMQILMILALLLKREYDPPTALAFACLAMLTVNPLVITSISFQLSVGSVAGIILCSGRIRGWLLDEKRLGAGKGKSLRARLARWLVNSISMTLGAMVLTVPLCAWYFGIVSLIGILTNLLTLWVVSFIFYGILLVCLLGAVFLPLGGLAARVVSWPIRYVLAVSKFLAGFPLAAVYTKSDYIVAWLVFVYLLLGVFLFSKRKKPGVLLCCGVLGLCLALGASWMEPLLGNFRMTVLNVGQGQCILLQSDGKTYMVDCGGDSDTGTADIAAETLLSQGIDHLDGLILTHYDADHSGSVQYLMTRIDIDTLFLPNMADEEQVGIALASQTRGSVCWLSGDLELSYGDTVLTILAPSGDGTDNESGLCVLFQTGNYDILITGDRGVKGELELLRHWEMPELEVLVVGHHGSKNSTSPALLEETNPKVAVISVGVENPYGHPAEQTLERLEALGCVIYRTDQNGTIIIRG